MTLEAAWGSTPSERTMSAIASVLGDAFSFEAIQTYTEATRGKPLKIETDTMPVAMTGYCVALQDVDLICTRTGMDDILTQIACLHEIAHLLLGHIPQLSNGPATPGYAGFQRRRELHRATFRAHGTPYDVPQEREAETLATLLLECILVENITIPRIARGIHG